MQLYQCATGHRDALAHVGNPGVPAHPTILGHHIPFPVTKRNGTVVNGGCPQAADLQRVLDALPGAMARAIEARTGSDPFEWDPDLNGDGVVEFAELNAAMNDPSPRYDGPLHFDLEQCKPTWALVENPRVRRAMEKLPADLRTPEAYDKHARRLWEALLRRARELLPRARLSVWGIPRAKTREDRAAMAWFHDLLDEWAPVLYPNDKWPFVETRAKAKLSLCEGKPTSVWISPRFTAGQRRGQWLTDAELERYVRALRGADALVAWSGFGSEHDGPEVERFNERIAALRRIVEGA